MSDRLQKVLSQWGVASRRGAEQMILEQRVRINGAIAQLGQKADPDTDDIEVDGKRLKRRPQSVYLLMHKPFGVVSTCDDPQGRKTVLDLLSKSERSHQGIHPVGRLDLASTGALLLTNDGEMTFRLTHPRHSLAKTYEVWVEGRPSAAVIHQWRQGVLLSGKQTRPAQVTCLRSEIDRALLRVILKEGRNRQIRRVAEQLGHPVLSLHRTAIAKIKLGTLAPGQYRPLTVKEIQSL
ncbi:MAG: pseudouridine synthase [Elainellaceae cyanobacterium]